MGNVSLYQIIVRPTATGLLTNVFQLSSTLQTDPNPANNSVTVISTVTNGTAVLADVSLRAGAAPEPVGVGSNLVYSLTVSNAGPATATGVIVSNQLPASVNFVSATGGATPSSGVLLLNLGSVAVGAASSVQITVQPTTAGKLTNLFQVFASQTDPVPANNSATVVSTVTNVTAVGAADVSLSASTGAGTITLGSGEAYYLTVSNAGPAAASGVVISNQLPANEIFVSVTGGATPVNGVLLVNLGTLAAGAATNITLTVNPGLPAGAAYGQLTNQFQVFASTTDPVLTNNSATVVSSVSALIPGTPLTYIGNNPGGAVIVSAAFGFGIGPINDGFTEIPPFQTLTATPGDLILLNDPTGGNNPTNWVAVLRFFNPADPTGTNSLAATESQTFFATNYHGSGFAGFQLFPNTYFFPAGSINTTNGVTSAGGTFDEFGPAGVYLAGQEDITVVTVTSPYTDLSLTASAAPQPGTVGSNLVYTITVSNAPNIYYPSNTVTATGVVVSNRIPANCTFVSATGGATPSGGVLLMNLGSLAEGTNISVQVVVQPTAAGSLTNNFQVFANEFDPNLTNNSAAVISTVTNATVAAAPAVPGTPIAWTNPGGSLVLSSTFGFAGNPIPIQTGPGLPAGAASTCQAGDLVLLCTNNGVTVPTNWAAVVRFYNPADPTGTVGLAATYEQTFFATNFGGSGFNGYQLFPVVSYIPEGTVATNANGLISFTTTYTQFGPAGGILAGQEEIDVVSLYTLTSAVNITSPTAGQVVSNTAFTVTGTTTNFLFTGFNLNSAVTNVFVQLNGGGWSSATSVNGWTNWSANVTLTPGSNTVSAYAVNGYGSFSPTNSVTFDYVPGSVGQADLSLTASAAPEPVGAGNNLVYSLTVSNAPLQVAALKTSSLFLVAATDVTISNRLPAGVTFVSATGGVTPTNGLLLINLGTLAYGATNGAQIVVSPNVAGQLTNVFAVFADQTDPVPANNSVTVVSTVTNVTTLRPLTVTITAPVAGQQVSNATFTVTGTAAIGNVPPPATVQPTNPVKAQPASSPNVQPVDALTNVYVQLNNGGWTSATPVNGWANWSALVTLTPGSNTVRAYARDSYGSVSPTNAVTFDYVTNSSPLPVDVALSIIAAPNPVNVGAPLTYSLTVTNNSLTTATSVVVSNTLPANVSFISALPSQGSATNKSGMVTYFVGSLPNGDAATLAIVVIPNAAGLLTNQAVAFSLQSDSQPANNRVTNVTTAVSVPATNLSLTVISPITLNLQTGLFEERVRVVNGGPLTPSWVRVLVAGLASNARLYNASGTTNGLPYVQSNAPLGVGNHVDFLLEYYVPTRVMPKNLTLTVQAGPPVVRGTVSSPVASLDRVMLSGGRAKFEFNTVPGQIYAVQYSRDLVTWRTALPAMSAATNRVEWLDAGPPMTDGNPNQQSARYYRVVLLPAN